MKFHHIGIAVKDINESVKSMKNLSICHVSGRVYDGGQNATLQMYDIGGIKIELIEGAVVKNVLGDDNFKIYHVCFTVDNINDAIDIAKKTGYVQITETKPAPLFDDRKVVFMLNNDKFMIEFLEESTKEVVHI